MKRRDDIKKIVSGRGILIAAFGLFAVGTVGCLWDSSLYDTFVNDDGYTIRCPNVSSILLNDNKTSLECIYSNSGDSDDPEAAECTLDGFKLIKYEGTESNAFDADACAEDSGSDACREREDLFDKYKDVFNYQLCPNGFQCDEDAKKCIPDKTKLPFCNGKYVDPETDTNYCGAKYGGQCNSEDKDSKDYRGEKCDLAMICVGGQCVPNCEKGQVFCGTSCIYPKTENKYCGAAVGGACNDEDPVSKNYKGEKCGAGMVCVNGECEFNTCNDDEILCLVNGVKECKNIESDDANHCGACNYKCADHLIPNASSSSCQNGACIYTCNEGYVNVSTSTTADSIECIDPMTNSEHCNATGLDYVGEQCDPGKVCVQGECVQNSCTSPDTLCFDSNSNKNACINVNSDNADHCGVCNYRCADHKILNASSESCEAGACVYECDENYVNVSTETSANEIECINPMTDSRYCGATSAEDRGVACDDNQVCIDGNCEYNSCVGDTPNLCVVDGKNVCKNINSGDADHCGACNYRCISHPIPNAISDKCEDGYCRYECMDGFVNISTSDTANTIGCINPLSDSTYCGATSASDLGTTCSDGTVCVGGECVQNDCADNESFPHLCVVSGKNECKNINSDDPEHCGACNYKCSEHAIPNATSDACLGGDCQYKCLTGYVNVGSGKTMQTINCIDPQTDNTYCGATNSSVGTPCPVGMVCVSGACVQNSCTNSNETLCYDIANKKNDCFNVNSDNVNHCGTCNYKCSEHIPVNAELDTTACVSGNCQYKCSGGFVNVGSGKTMQKIKCIDPKTDDQNCGATNSSKGTTCTGGTVCVNGGCVQNSCTNSGETLCYVNGSNTCIKNVKTTNADHCGACNYKCSDHVPAHALIQGTGSGTCSSGKCQYKCEDGYYNRNNKTDYSIQCVEIGTSECCGSSCNTCLVGQKCSNKTSSGTCVDVCPPSAPNNCFGGCYKNDVLNTYHFAVSNGSCGCANAYSRDGSICVEATNAHCKKDGTACSAPQVCQASSNSCVNCSAGTSYVSGNCETATDAHCKTDGTACSGSKPKCIVASNTCVECLDSSHCKKTNATGTCSSNTCNFVCNKGYSMNGSSCETATDAHCKTDGTGCSGSTPRCRVADNTCVECTTNSHCSKTNATGTCSNNTCSFVCNKGYSWVDGACVTATDAHCKTDGTGCSGSTPRCRVSDNTCVECTVNTHCTKTNATGTCSSNSCSFVCNKGFSLVDGACVTATDAHCKTDGTGCSGSTPRCRVSDNTCVECTVNTHCTKTNATGTCSSNKCSFVCNKGYSLVDGACVAATDEHCKTDGTGCSGTKPRCRAADNTCVECTANTHCTKENATGTCASNACKFECNDGFSLVSGSCVTASDDHCLKDGTACTAPKVCDITNNACVNP